MVKVHFWLSNPGRALSVTGMKVAVMNESQLIAVVRGQL